MGVRTERRLNPNDIITVWWCHKLWPLVGTDAVAAIGINRLKGNRRPAVSRGVAFLLERNGGISGVLMHHVPSAVATKTTVRSGWTIRLEPRALLLSVMQGRPVRLISARQQGRDIDKSRLAGVMRCQRSDLDKERQ
jgi:hypothetical protein